MHQWKKLDLRHVADTKVIVDLELPPRSRCVEMAVFMDNLLIAIFDVPVVGLRIFLIDPEKKIATEVQPSPEFIACPQCESKYMLGRQNMWHPTQNKK